MTDGLTLAVGAPYDGAIPGIDISNVGATWIYARNGSGNFTQLGKKIVGKGFMYNQGAYGEKGTSYA